MAGAGKKTFTAGETLTASDVNTYLMEQSVMYFGGTAARSSAIPTPSTGMTSYIGVTGTATIPQIETYTGSAWQTPYGLTLLSNTSFSSATSITVDNVFTSAYSHYRVIFHVTAVAGTAGQVGFQFRSSGSTTSTNYVYNHLRAYSTSVNSNNGTTSQVQVYGSAYSPPLTMISDVFNPQLATTTAFNVDGLVRDSSENIGFWARGYQNSTTQFDGIIFSGSPTLTGTLKIYGYRNS